MASRKKRPAPRAPRDRDVGGSPGKRIHRTIVDEVRRRIAASPGGHLVNGRLGELELQVEINLGDPGSGERALAGAVEGAIDRFVDDAIQAAAAFRPGRAFCHRCESAGCRHAAPPGPRHAFGGYTPTGLPRWIEFGQLCLDLRHPQIDRLYEKRAILTQIVSGAFLKADLLPEFHRSARVHDVAGQVCAGLFPVPGVAGGLALTFQAVVTRRGRGRRWVGLNLLGGAEEALDAAHPEAKPWRGDCRWAQSRLDDLGRRSGRARLTEAALEREVEGVLQGLARRIERGLRGRGRRTRHAEERHRSGERPTRKAVDDLRAAGEGSILIDARHETLVVLGPRGRTHFFAPEGRLVSSVHYPPEAIARKIQLGHWKPAADRDVNGLRAHVEESTGT